MRPRDSAASRQHLRLRAAKFTGFRRAPFMLLLCKVRPNPSFNPDALRQPGLAAQRLLSIMRRTAKPVRLRARG